jgi:hypothetical protein
MAQSQCGLFQMENGLRTEEAVSLTILVFIVLLFVE